MLKPYETYAPRANIPDANYPLGSIKNQSVPGAKDGTPLDNRWGNNIEGFHQALLVEAGITADGQIEKVGASQLLSAVKSVGKKQSITTVENNAALRLVVPVASGQRFSTKCRDVPGDGGGGDWYYDPLSTTTSDGGTIEPCGAVGRMIRIYSGGVHVRWFGTNAAAFQAAANLSNVILLTSGSEYNIGATTINFPNFGTSIVGQGGMYSGGTVRYSGPGIAFNFASGTQYNNCRNFTLINTSSIPTNFYDSGTVGMNFVASSVVMIDCRVSGFEYLVQSNYDSYYNKFIDCRFDRAKIILNKFSVNNLEAKGNRCKEFNTFARTAGNNGPFSLTRNSFEVFNGNIVLTTELSHVIAKENYIETYYNTTAPTNFPVNPLGYFTDAILFAGEYCVLDVQNNNIDMRGARRIVSASICKRLVSKNNDITDFDTSSGFSSFVDQLYSIDNQCDDVYINDQLNSLNGSNTLVNPLRTRGYSFIPMTSPNNNFYYYDAIQKGSTFANVNGRLIALDLINAWKNDNNLVNRLKLRLTESGSYIAGVIDGSSSTGAVAFNIPALYRPKAVSTDVTFFRFTVFNNYGDTPSESITFRYIYSSGNVQMETVPTSKLRIVFDGTFIPNM